MDIAPNSALTTLITGLPRSGTTLVCALLNQVPDVVALVEPIIFDPSCDRLLALQQIDCFVRDARQMILHRGEAVSRQIDGQIPSELMQPLDGVSGLRHLRAHRGVVRIKRQLSPSFHLVIKHHGEFMAMAEALISRYRLFAVVRHPLAALASWQTVDLPIHDGHLKSAECFSPELSECLAAEPDRLSRQVTLMEFLFRRFSSPCFTAILRYEDLADDPISSLSHVIRQARGGTLDVNRIVPEVRYGSVDLASLARALLPAAAAFAQFYPDITRDLQRYA